MMRTFNLYVIILLLTGTLLACSNADEAIHIKPSSQQHTKVAADNKTKESTANEENHIDSSGITLKSKVEPLPKKVIIDAPLISQLPELPNGCEVTSLAMLLQQAGIKVDKLTLAKEIKKVPFKENGVYGDPNDGFVGNMYPGPPGFAVYHGPVAELAKKYLGTKVVDLTGSKWSVIEEQLSQNHPVWVIVNSAFKWLPPEYFQDWHTKNGEMQVTMHEHSVLVTGYDEKKVYFNDPLTKIKNKSVAKDDFKEAWKQMGSQAISYNN
jgi:uncharacterized protein YvpB